MLQRATADGAESADVGLSAGAWCLGDAGLSSLANRRQVASLFDRIEKERNAAARELAPPRERWADYTPGFVNTGLYMYK